MSNSDFYSATDMIEREGNGEQSLLTAMNKFVQAVNDMDETVMIPSKLMDISTETNQNSKNALIAVTDSKRKTPGDLYCFYSMLNAIKGELVRGPKSDEDLEEEQKKEMSSETRTQAEELSKKTASMFRFHLRGLFSVLGQLTDTAEHITSKYQDDIGEYNCRAGSNFPKKTSISSFL